MAGLKLKKVAPASRETLPGSLDRRTPRHGKKGSIFSKAFSYKDKEAFYQELAIMLTAGVDIKSALDIVVSKYKRGHLQKSIQAIQREIIGGASLSEALRHAGLFSAYECHSLMIGEETGKIAHVLQMLAEHYQKRIRLRRQMIQTLSYPVIVLMTALGAIVFMLKFIVPMFSDVFSRFGGELPALTTFIIQAAGWLDAYFLYVLLFLAGLAGMLHRCREKVWMRRSSSYLLLRMPILGELARVMLMARLTEALALLLGAKVPLVRAVALVRQMIGFYSLETSLHQVEQDIMTGSSLHKSLAGFPMYDDRLLALVKVGEESNQLDFFFAKMAKQYAEDVEHRSAVLGTLLEPLIIIFLGLVVGVVLMALYLPLFELSNNF